MIPQTSVRHSIRPFVSVAVASVAGCALSVILLGHVQSGLAIAIGAAIPLVATALLAIWFERQWAKPATQVCDVAEHLAAHNWSTRAEPTGAATLLTTGLALNSIAREVGQYLADFAGRSTDLQTVADAIPDPIVLTDREHRIAVLNDAGSLLLKVPANQAVGKLVSTVVNDESILRILDLVAPDRNGSTAGAGAIRHHQIRLLRGGHKITYQAVVRSTNGGGVLLLLRDVSTVAGTAQMKTDFVANASHELRTPITAIKIAFETLTDVYREDPDVTEICLAIIAGHLKRLEEMLQDLLDLSRVEAPSVEPTFVQIILEQLFTGLRAGMESSARQKLVELAIGESPRPVPDLFISDVRLLNLVIRNLVENAIKFTSAGGRVSVDIVQGEDEMVELIVADTGIGIPPEHLERVFERFYQVDAARSGSAGRGTGLGLAIVKHAVHALGGTVDLKSQVGVGTTMTCRLPARVPASV